MQRILIVSFTDPKNDPRVFRQIDALADQYAITSCGYGTAPPRVARHLEISPIARRASARAIALALLKLRRYEWYYWSHPRIRNAYSTLRDTGFDLVIANDLVTLPLALKIAGGAPVLFDAHEFAPLEYEDQWIWRFFLARYNHEMSRRYLPQAAKVVTVCESIAKRYANDYGVGAEVITNAAPLCQLPVRRTGEKRIRMIHHGAAIVSRQNERMIEMMAFLDERFTLDLILVPGDSRYIGRLKGMAQRDARIRFLDRVPMEQLVAVSSQYDVGLFLLPPTNFNYRMTLPNKFFEFIQARLAVAIGPSPEMARIVREFNCGIVAEDFLPHSLACALNRLRAADIDEMKLGSDRAARAHNAERNGENLRSLVSSVIVRAA